MGLIWGGKILANGSYAYIHVLNFVELQEWIILSPRLKAYNDYNIGNKQACNQVRPEKAQLQTWSK